MLDGPVATEKISGFFVMHGMESDNVAFPSGADYVQVPGKRRNFAKSAVRALEVLDEFAIRQTSLRAVQIGSALGLHPSSVDQLLKTMVDAGYLLFDERAKLYAPSPRLNVFANWLGQGRWGNIPSLIELIHRKLGVHVMLCVRQRYQMQIAIVCGAEQEASYIAPGIKFPLLDSTCGLAALCDFAMEEIAEIVAGAKRYRVDREAEFQKIISDVEAVKTAGFAMGHHPEAGRIILAVPLASGILPKGWAVSMSASDRKIIDPTYMARTTQRLADEFFA